MSLENRVDKIEEAILVMKDLLVSHDDRLEDYYKTMRESRADFDFKINALIDAQMKNEAEIAEVKESITVVKESITELRKVSESTLHRVEGLENR